MDNFKFNFINEKKMNLNEIRRVERFLKNELFVSYGILPDGRGAMFTNRVSKIKAMFPNQLVIKVTDVEGYREVVLEYIEQKKKLDRIYRYK